MARLSFDPIALGKLIAAVWDDPVLRVRLLSNPKEVLAGAGVRIGDNRRVVVVEDTEVTVHVVIPKRPDGPVPQDQQYLVQLGCGILDGCSEKPGPGSPTPPSNPGNPPGPGPSPDPGQDPSPSPDDSPNEIGQVPKRST